MYALLGRCVQCRLVCNTRPMTFPVAQLRRTGHACIPVSAHEVQRRQQQNIVVAWPRWLSVQWPGQGQQLTTFMKTSASSDRPKYRRTIREIAKPCTHPELFQRAYQELLRAEVRDYGHVCPGFAIGVTAPSNQYYNFLYGYSWFTHVLAAQKQTCAARVTCPSIVTRS